METNLVTRQNSEGINNLLGGIGIGTFTSHEIEESIKGNVSRRIGIYDGHDPPKLDIALLVTSDVVSKAYKARFEFIWI